MKLTPAAAIQPPEQIRPPEVPLSPPPMEDPLQVASQLRILRERLADEQATLRSMREHLDPRVQAVWDAVDSLPSRITELEDKLKAACRTLRTTLDLRAQGVRVGFSNPCRDEVDLQDLLKICPEAERSAPEVFVHTTTVDAKLFLLAVASGALPEAAMGAYREVPTTREGRVALEYVRSPE